MKAVATVGEWSRIATWAAVGVIAWGCQLVCAAEFAGQPTEAQSEGFLHPDGILSRECATPANSRPHAGGGFGESSTHICISHFAEPDSWIPKASGVKHDIAYPFDAVRDSRVLAIRLENMRTNAKDRVLRLSSERAQELRFSRIDSVRMWVKGNGSSAGLRVWVVDRDGEAFTSQRPLWLNFDTWSFEDISFEKDYVLNHGKAANGIPDPPLTVHRVSISGSSQAMQGEVRLGRLSVIGVPWAGTTASAGASEASPRMPSTPVVLQLADPGPKRSPFKPASVRKIDLLLRNESDTPTTARVSTSFRRMFGATATHEASQQLAAGSRRKLSIPVETTIPGWYRFVACAHPETGKASCVHDEYLIWDPVGNEEEDSPPTFGGAMVSADYFLEKLGSDLRLMKQAGVKVLRFPFRWDMIEKEPGEYNWRTYDAIFRECRLANIVPQPMVVQTPDWARRTPYRKASGGKSATAFTPPADLESFRKFMERAASRYAESSPYWEIWNEPISRHSWAGGTNADYIALLRAGYNAVKSADASAHVLSAGAWAVDGGPERFSRHLMEHGSEFFDILAVHSHGGVNQLRGTLDDFDALWAGRDRPPIWLNETGVRVDPRRADGELLRASETAKKMVVARARGVENYGWFLIRHYPDSYRSPYNNFSVIDERGEPRPVLLAYNNAIRWLRRTTLEADVSKTQYSAYEFRDHRRRVLVAWANDPEAVTRLESLPEWTKAGFDLYDQFGGIQTPVGNIELTGNPVFLVSRDLARE